MPAISEWPKPQSSRLVELVDALRARSKALSYRVGDFEIELEGEGHTERLNLRMRRGGPSTEQLALNFFGFGPMYLFAGRGTKSGWEYKISFYADSGAVAPTVLVELIEQSLMGFGRV